MRSGVRVKNAADDCADDDDGEANLWIEIFSDVEINPSTNRADVDARIAANAAEYRDASLIRE